VKKSIFICFGTITLILGVIGVFLPLLPTTPFLLLSAYFYGKSSEKMQQWLLSNKIFGKYIKDYHEKKGITMKNKIISILFLIVSISFSMYKMQNLHLRIFLTVILIAVSVHILKIKTVE
jgi:uncharacterized membrane protein YbaN (DUF454 family)